MMGTKVSATRLTGAAIAAAAAGLFAMGAPAPVLADEGGKIHCEGVNSCKGKSDCASAKNSCQGQNSCKGQGFKEMTAEECAKAKAEMQSEKK
jgi:hypothetical protein